MQAPRTFATSISVTDAASYSDPVIVNGSGMTMTATATSAPGSDPLITFSIQLQSSPGGPWIDYLSGADFASTSIATMLFCSTQKPTDLDATESSLFMVGVGGVYAFRFAATCDTSETATINIAGGVNGSGQ